MLLDGQLQPGQQVHIEVKGDHLDFSVSGTPTDKGASERDKAKAAAASARSPQQTADSAAAASAGGASAGAHGSSDTRQSGGSSHGGHQPRRNGRDHSGDGKRSQ